MTPSEYAKKNGCKSLRQVSIVSGESTQTLNNWYKNRRYVFVSVVEKVAREMNEK